MQNFLTYHHTDVVENSGYQYYGKAPWILMDSQFIDMTGKSGSMIYDIGYRYAPMVLENVLFQNIVNAMLSIYVVVLEGEEEMMGRLILTDFESKTFYGEFYSYVNIWEYGIASFTDCKISETNSVV